MKSKFTPTVSKSENPNEYMRQYMAWRRATDPEFKRKQQERSKAYYWQKIAPTKSRKSKLSGMTPEQKKQHQAELWKAWRNAHRLEINAKNRARYANDPEYKHHISEKVRIWRKNEYAKSPDFRKYAALSTAASIAKNVLKDQQLADKIKAVRNAFKKGA